jgi:tRNA modification GTPase
VGGIAVLRLSGPDALQMALNHLSVDRLEPRRATYCRIGNLDDGIAIYYVAPNCYTGEPTVELSCHGSLYVQQALLQLFVDGGARLATAGEFTLRAFLNGRIDLSQAEAVADLIDAVTPVQHRLAVSQLRGGYAKELDLYKHTATAWEVVPGLEVQLAWSQDPYRSGCVSRKNLTRIAGTPAVVTARLGKGAVVYFQEEINFRSYWFASNHLLTNALYFGDLL